MSLTLDMGLGPDGAPAHMDPAELLATRLLVQGNSGSGKSHLLRRLAEQSAGLVQQVLIDPEGDFVTLAEPFGHVVVDAAAHRETGLARIAGRVRRHRVSVVLDLEGLEPERQMRHAAAFLNGLFETERDAWYPVLVIVDEAQLFAPTAAGDVADEVRRLSLGAMTNLMCRGRKRGLAGVIATQRLAKLAKNVAAEASNFLMGRTFLDIDMARAADLLGMDRRKAEMFRDLDRGRFVALGPALARRPLEVRIGGVETAGRGGGPDLVPLPGTAPEDARALLLEADPQEAAPPPPPPPPPSTEDVMAAVEAAGAPEPAADSATDAGSGPAPADPAADPAFDAATRAVLDDPEAAYRPVAELYQAFLAECRSRGVNGRLVELTRFRRGLTAARAGLPAGWESDPDCAAAAAAAESLDEELQGLFLMLARAALDGAPCPSDAALARARGSRSPRRARGLLGHLEQQGAIAQQEDVFGQRIVHVTALGRQSAPGDPDADM